MAPETEQITVEEIVETLKAIEDGTIPFSSAASWLRRVREILERFPDREVAIEIQLGGITPIPQAGWLAKRCEPDVTG